MPWKKGESGNPGGRPKHAKLLTDAIRMELARDPKRARRIAVQLLDMAEDGDVNAAKLVFERLEGKPDQQIDQSVTIDGTVRHEISRDERERRVAELMGKIGSPKLIQVEDAEQV